MPAERHELSSTASHLLTQLAEVLGADRIQLFGGAALDLLRDTSTHCYDIDVALPAGCLESFDPGKEIEIVGQQRPYWIRHTTPVVMITARWSSQVLDLNFLDDVDKIGHFDVERVSWDYPGCTFADPHKITAEPVRTFHLVTAPGSDNPILLLNRLIKLAAKYEVPFWRQRHLSDLVEHLTASAIDWMPANDFHGVQAHDAHLRAIARSVRRAQRPEVFLDGCLRAGVLDALLHPLADLLRCAPANLARLAEATSDVSFWRIADHLVADGSAEWRQYRREDRCDSVS